MSEPGRIGPDFDRATFTHQGRTHEVFRAGCGPAVIVIHEFPGLGPRVVDFGRRLIKLGYTVYLPSLFGRPGEARDTVADLRSFLRVCVSREFALLTNRTSPAVSWLRGLAAKAYRERGGLGVGAVGMCFTGGFALAMAIEPEVLAPVVSQPSIPAWFTARQRAALGLDAGDVATIKERTWHGLCILGLRFSNDKVCPAERFKTLRTTFGAAFEGIEIDSSPGNPFGITPRAHSVLALDFVDQPGHPTRVALDRVLAFLNQRLQPSEQVP